MNSIRSLHCFIAVAIALLLVPQSSKSQIPPVVDPHNIYSETTAGKLSPAVAGALNRVYVPNLKSGDIYVIDPATYQVVDKFNVGGNPQHIIPSWDLKTLWIAGSAERQRSGILTPIDPKTGKPGTTIPSLCSALPATQSVFKSHDGITCWGSPPTLNLSTT